jgi:archaellum component FlaG (FlaF/FlaG flagellin family)
MSEHPGRLPTPDRPFLKKAALLVVLMATLFVASSCYTNLQAISTSSTVSSVASWGVVPTSTSVASAPPCLSSPSSCGPFSSSGSSTYYFNIWNTGTVAVTGLSYVLTSTTNTWLFACSVAWVNGACWGTLTLEFGPVTSGTYLVSGGVLPTNPGAEVYMEAVLSTPSAINVSISVSSGSTRQIRAAATTNA